MAFLSKVSYSLGDMKAIKNVYWLIFACTFLPVFTLDYIIQTPSGRIQGITTLFENNTIFQFRNIPYAKPPIDNLRFQKPVPFGPWKGVRNGAHFGPSCIQNMRYHNIMRLQLENKTSSEDCLSLNVYVPYNLTITDRTVMIWVHGGGYILGQGQLYDASALAATGDVIVVTLNYRLGIFGFLSTGDHAARGNYGLWDQHLAFRWVKNNIASFGGNPGSVTIFGNSAGGMSVNFHSFATHNKGLFKRVISQSGVSNSYIATTKAASFFAKQYGLDLNCINSTDIYIDTEKLVTCLRNKSSEDIFGSFNRVHQKTSSLIKGIQMSADTGVVIDGEFVVDTPHNMLNDITSESHKMFKSMDYIIGNCNNDGTIFLSTLRYFGGQLNYNFFSGIPSSTACEFFFPNIIQNLYSVENNTNARIATKAVCNKYKSSDIVKQGRRILNSFSDALFITPSVETLDSHSRENNQTITFQYMFNVPNLLDRGSPSPEWLKGSPHEAELLFLFGFSNILRNSGLPVTKPGLDLSNIMLKYWTNFAKTGNPNGEGLPYWPSYNTVQKSYINLDMSISTGTSVSKEQVFFWRSFIPNIMRSTSLVPSPVGK